MRTIQRIEKGQKAGLESLKSLAAVFDIQLMELQKEPEMTDELKVSPDKKNSLCVLKYLNMQKA